MSEAMLHADLNVLTQFVNLPHLHRSRDNRTVIETREDMIKGFATFSDSLKAQGANQFIRLAGSAEYLSDDYIRGTHVTHVLRNATPVVPSFVNRAVLRRGHDNWKLVENFGDYTSDGWPVRILQVTAKARSSDEISHTDARRESAQPLALYQRFLNALTRANVTDDFDAYCDLCMFPHSSHTAQSDTIREAPEDVRVVFDGISRVLSDNNVDEFARIADHAEFISGDTICGYHIAHFLSAGKETLEAIKSRMILRRIGTRWFLQAVTNSVANEDFKFGEPVLTEDLVTQVDIQKRTKTDE